MWLRGKNTILMVWEVGNVFWVEPAKGCLVLGFLALEEIAQPFLFVLTWRLVFRRLGGWEQ
jgi:hypothetical protein